MPITTPQQYADALRIGRADDIVGLSGRALRGRKGHPEDFEFLTEQKDILGRRIIFMIAEQGLKNCLDLTGWEMFIHPDGVGYDVDYLVALLEKDYEFKMAVFGHHSAAKPATWDNLLPMLCEMYPEGADAFTRHWPQIADPNIHLDYWERLAGYEFLAVQNAKDNRAQPGFMTWERFLASDMTALDVRKVLYFEAGHLRENFSGDGFTWTGRTNNPQRVRGPREFIAPNKRLADCGDHVLIDIDVRIPSTFKKKSVAVAATPVSVSSPQSTKVIAMSDIAKHVPLVFTPKFWDPAKAYQRYQPDISRAMQEGIAYARANNLLPAQKLMGKGIANAAMLTDLQDDFRDDGRLPVKGTDDVVLRTCARLLNGTVNDWYTGLFFSLDGHPPVHISFGSYYRDSQGMPLDLSTRKAACMTLTDPSGGANRAKCVFRCYGFSATGTIEELGYYQPAFDPQDAVAYWDHLQATGQGDIWVFTEHCVLGTDGTNLHPLLVETIAFMSGARSFQPTIIGKGHISTTDWFGPLCPCRPDSDHPQGDFQKGIVDAFKLFATVDFFGVAEDFCDFNMKRQTMEYLAGTEYLAKLQFVMDGTAPIVPNMPHVTKLNAEARKAGVKFINHDTPFGQVA